MFNPFKRKPAYDANKVFEAVEAKLFPTQPTDQPWVYNGEVLRLNVANIGTITPITAADTNTPEYHLELTVRMIDTLQHRIALAVASQIDQQEAFEADRDERLAAQQASDQAQASEITGLRRTIGAYVAARDMLSPVQPAPARDVIDVEAPLVINPTPAQRRRRPSRSGRRETFVIPEGHEAVRDAEGRATGETRPITPQ